MPKSFKSQTSELFDDHTVGPGTRIVVGRSVWLLPIANVLVGAGRQPGGEVGTRGVRCEAAARGAAGCRGGPEALGRSQNGHVEREAEDSGDC